MTHKCPIDGCRTSLPQNVLLCARHWAMLPLWLQGAVQEAMERITRIERARKEAAPPLPEQHEASQ